MHNRTVNSLILITLGMFLSSCYPAYDKVHDNIVPVPPATLSDFSDDFPYQKGFVWFYKPPEESQLSLLPEYFDFFILTHNDEEELQFLRASGVENPIINYLQLIEIHDPGDCESDPRGNQVAYLPGDFCRISSEHPDWFLLDTFGNRIVDDENYYNMDPGNVEFQEFWLRRAIELQNKYGWEGVFIDNVEASLSKYYRNGALPSKYPSDVSLQVAIADFLSYIRKNQAGVVYANIISLKDWQVWEQYMNYLDGAMLENFAVDWLGSNITPAEWEAEMKTLSLSQQKNKMLLLVAQGDKDDIARQQFSYASYLLLNNGTSYFRYTHHSVYREIWWYDNYDYDFGKPLGSRYKISNSWFRDFEFGQVKIDLNTMQADLVLFQTSP